jgi:PAS domain S-box-containing protein
MTHAVVYPLVVGDDPLGAVALAGIAPPDPTVVEMLEAVGELFTSALHRERVERSFRNSEQRFARVVASALDGFAMVSESGVVLEWTAQAERILGWPRDEMMGGSLQEILGQSDRGSLADVADMYAKALKIPGKRLELTGRHRDGSEVPIELSISTLESDESMAFGVFIRDITERKRAEVVRQQAFDEISRLKRQIEGERDYLREEIREGRQVGDLVGESPALERVVALIESVASTSATVLIRGESGVGKELIARAIHSRSRRSEEPLVKVNCASVPKELFESEFFGHVRGAFTGALKDRAGRFELADRGTLFLDEVGEIPLDLQAKLLRVLQEKEFERVGAEKTRKVDVRIIAATNRDLAAEAAAGRFRKDLYYRLSVFPIEIPPLRERREDIVPLAEHFLKLQRRALGRPHLALGDEHRKRLLAYDWPGNVRELQHVIERAVILAREGPLRVDLALPAAAAAEPTLGGKDRVLTDEALREIERDNLTTALDRCDWRIAGTGGAAELLGLSPSTLRDRMRVFDIQRPKRA